MDGHLDAGDSGALPRLERHGRREFTTGGVPRRLSQRVFTMRSDGLIGLPQAIEAAFPKAVVQTCIVHMIRASLRCVTWSDRKKVAAAMRPIYAAENETAGPN
jgi:transposase-like protein